MQLAMITDDSLLSFLFSTDLLALIGNIFGNVFEATLKLPAQNRSIGFVVKNSSLFSSMRKIPTTAKSL